MRFDKGTKIVSAHRWWKNGDHPGDEPELIEPEDGSPAFVSEGKVVRRFRHPDFPGTLIHDCGSPYDTHGFIDEGKNGHMVCPGAWVIDTGSGHLVAHEDPFRDARTQQGAEPSEFVEDDPDGETQRVFKVWFYADCRNCKGRRRFGSAEERDAFVVEHQSDPRHAVDAYEVER